MAAGAGDRRRRRHRGWRACDWGAVALRWMGGQMRCDAMRWTGARVRARILPSPDSGYGFVARA